MSLKHRFFRWQFDSFPQLFFGECFIRRYHKNCHLWDPTPGSKLQKTEFRDSKLSKGEEFSLRHRSCVIEKPIKSCGHENGNFHVMSYQHHWINDKTIYNPLLLFQRVVSCMSSVRKNPSQTPNFFCELLQGGNGKLKAYINMVNHDLDKLLKWKSRGARLCSPGFSCIQNELLLFHTTLPPNKKGL